jgi:hypothetical protein
VKIEISDQDAEYLYLMFHDPDAAPASPHNRRYFVYVNWTKDIPRNLSQKALIKTGTAARALVMQWDTGQELAEQGRAEYVAKLTDLGRIVYQSVADRVAYGEKLAIAPLALAITQGAAA